MLELIVCMDLMDTEVVKQTNKTPQDKLLVKKLLNDKTALQKGIRKKSFFTWDQNRTSLI